jgi:hypothetical protein
MPCKTIPFIGLRNWNVLDRPVSRSLAIFIDGMALPRPDLFDSHSQVYGMCKRVLRLPPKSDRHVMRRFRIFVRSWVRRKLNPLSAVHDVSFEPWIADRPYPETRKIELRAAFVLLKHKIEKWEEKVKSHIKDESYVEYKINRWINSRQDAFKVRCGPIFSAIEKETFKLPYFIKYVPVDQRPAYIKERLLKEGMFYHSTDYTSFESLFTPTLMRNCEMFLYQYMSQNLPEGKEWFSLVKQVLCDKYYTLSNGVIQAELRGTRMSGEMCTSLGNGFLNMMVTLFMLEEEGYESDRALFEGDDGLFSCPVRLTSRIPEALGLRIKMEISTNLGESSFCGNVFSESDLIVVTNIRETLVDFGWTKSQDVNSKQSRLDVILRSKAYSLLHQYNGTPVLVKFAQYVLRVTRRSESGIDKYVKNDRTLSEWERKSLATAVEAVRSKDFVVRKPGRSTRELVEKLYYVDLSEQYELEQYFDKCNERGAIDHPIIQRWKIYDHDWRDYFDKYNCSENPIRTRRDDPHYAIDHAVENITRLKTIRRLYGLGWCRYRDLCDP